jgi:hypothetical protein
MMAYGEVNVPIHVFLTLALGGEKWAVSRFSLFNPGERGSGILRIGGCVGLRTALHNVEKILDPTRTRTPTPTLRYFVIFFILCRENIY